MKPGTEVKKNFLRFYLDPTLLSKEEAEEALRKEGINIEQLRENEDRFIKKLEAKLKLAKGSKRKEKFKNMLNEFKDLKNKIVLETDDLDAQFAYRKKDNAALSGDEIEDIKMLKFLEMMEKEGKKKDR